MNKKSTRASEQRNLLQRIQARRAEKRLAKEQARKVKQTEKAREVKAKKRAVRENAVKQVQAAIDKSKRRSSHPFLTLVLMALTVGLSGAFVYQYREDEVITRDDQISSLQSEVSELSGLRQRIEAQIAAEEAKFQTVDFNSFSLRMPVEWVQQPTQFPAEETVYGDLNVTFRVLTESTRNSSSVFIPLVDYVWQLNQVDNQAVTVSKSLHCERFDTFSNDLQTTLREHQGFSVYCDVSSEKIVIFAASSPDAFGLEGSSTFFIVEVTDVQQIDLADIEAVIASYSPAATQ